MTVTNSMVRHSARLAGLIKRYHTWPTLRVQTVAEHTWHVMRIYLHLFGSPPPNVWEYMLHHDAPLEMGTGDIPFDSKRNNPELKAAVDLAEERFAKEIGFEWPEIGALEWARFKVCDLLEMLEFGTEERAMGNTYAEPIVEATTKAINSMLHNPAHKLADDHMAIVSYIQDHR